MVELDQSSGLLSEVDFEDIELPSIFELVRQEIHAGDVISLEEYTHLHTLTSHPIHHVHRYSSEAYPTST